MMDKRKENERNLAEWADKMAEIHGSADVDEILYEAERKERRDELKEEIQDTPVVGVFRIATEIQRARGERFSHEKDETSWWSDLLFPFIKFIGEVAGVIVLVLLCSLCLLVLVWGLKAIENAIF